MRGNWEAAEAMVLGPNHRLQQQQHTILEEQNRHHPLQLSTTPAWGIADRSVVKEEVIEDKASDSGISPDHYSNSTSPRSRRSSSTVNCSLSPGSATSHDSQAMQCSTYDYSSQNMFKNCDIPTQYPRVHTMETGSDNMKTRTVETREQGLPCPLNYCSFHTYDRIEFGEHVATHYAADETPDFSKYVPNNGQYSAGSELSPMDSESNRESPSQDDRSDQGDQEFDETDEPGVRVPRVNAQGKVKVFKCKQCDFTSITKLDFWEHSRGHIKMEKLLTCPKCPFVTEYKHHLEYHLRNHFGSKPFRCDKCSYSCVNKSMLNSHLKSHSNIYQYRCANCSYATKYLHSLKLHLRKYNHEPAMVLNADGTPNPLPIVDVYGTRRGPKQKSLTPKLDNESGTSNQNLPEDNQSAEKQHPQYQPQIKVPQLSPPMPQINPMNVISALAASNAISPLMALQYSHLYNQNFPMANPFGVNEEISDGQLEQFRQTLCVEYAKAMVNDKINNELSQDGHRFIKGLNFGMRAMTNPDIPATIDSVNATVDIDRSSQLTPELSPDGKFAPLDLSKPDITANNDNNNINNNKHIGNDEAQDYRHESLVKQANGDNELSTSPKTSGTSRRKGKAFKLAVRDAANESEEEHQNNAVVIPTTIPQTISTLVMPSSSASEHDDIKESVDKKAGKSVDMSSKEFTCQFCEIAFGNEVMYTVHMGYHGFKNPFTCNMCGHQCDDKVSFFLHIARSKHA